MPDPCVGVLLAGGAARRFGGEPKGLATIGGTRIADLALAALRLATTSQLVVANDPAARAWFPGERVVADEVTGLGPLAGIATALAAANGAPVTVLAWDMPFVSAALLGALQGLRAVHPNASAVVPRHGGTIEPLCAWYAPSALAECRRLLAAGERRAGALARSLPDTVWLEDEALAAFGDVRRTFTSVDTPEGLRALGGAHP